MKKFYVILISLFFCDFLFSQTLSFRCNFTDGQATNFDKGIPKINRETKFMELVFDQIDKTKSTARLIGNIGVAQIQALEGDESIHLVEITNSGNLNITTIFFTDKSKISGSFPVVHSRHMKTLSGPFPSQYVGTCRELLQ